MVVRIGWKFCGTQTTPRRGYGLWAKQHMFEEAKSEVLRALDVFEELGDTNDAEDTRKLLGWVGSMLENGQSRFL